MTLPRHLHEANSRPKDTTSKILVSLGVISVRIGHGSATYRDLLARNQRVLSIDCCTNNRDTTRPLIGQ